MGIAVRALCVIGFCVWKCCVTVIIHVFLMRVFATRLFIISVAGWRFRSIVVVCKLLFGERCKYFTFMVCTAEERNARRKLDKCVVIPRET